MLIIDPVKIRNFWISVILAGREWGHEMEQHKKTQTHGNFLGYRGKEETNPYKIELWGMRLDQTYSYLIYRDRRSQIKLDAGKQVSTLEQRGS